ncbi:FKBP-type peptidyl-prolyl cis-trans isomerase [Mangrovivirga cuniculi]|uniref:Peptidyl-prolyl cis-trans isomerase n=1 Tax=Mangrovivirga cuniculi TaxID=2715131 RepID=A0A4D7JQQ2_9BACT|nr:peptidylprolyl isomerase [Mangrovivirga cuniculi]QCK17063.1 peptidylprolyl isomerase [Mangrovivirga cuniculi]
MKKVEQNNKVKVHYTGKLESGEVFDSSEGREPLSFTVGAGQMIPGFEKGVLGMELNEKKTITIESEDAYGDRRDDLIQSVPKSQLPEDLNPHEGQQLQSQTSTGQVIPVVVTNVSEEEITVDANHPLAGKTLVFDVEVVGIDE